MCLCKKKPNPYKRLVLVLAMATSMASPMKSY